MWCLEQHSDLVTRVDALLDDLAAAPRAPAVQRQATLDLLRAEFERFLAAVYHPSQKFLHSPEALLAFDGDAVSVVHAPRHDHGKMLTRHARPPAGSARGDRGAAGPVEHAVLVQRAVPARAAARGVPAGGVAALRVTFFVV